MTGFRNTYFTPTSAQAELIGRIVSDWAIVDFTLAQIATRLALSPSFPARSLTDRLHGSAIELAIRNLLDMHGERYRTAIIPTALITRIRSVGKSAARLRKDRNIFAHAIGLRMSDDELAMADLRGWGTAKDEPALSLQKMRELHLKISALTTDLEALLSAIPEVDEAMLVKVLANGPATLDDAADGSSA